MGRKLCLSLFNKHIALAQIFAWNMSATTRPLALFQGRIYVSCMQAQFLATTLIQTMSMLVTFQKLAVGGVRCLVK